MRLASVKTLIEVREVGVSAPESRNGVGDVSFDGSGGEAQFLGDGGDGLIIEIPQHDARPFAGREA